MHKISKDKIYLLVRLLEEQKTLETKPETKHNLRIKKKILESLNARGIDELINNTKKRIEELENGK